MIFYNGEIYETDKQTELLDRLGADIDKTLTAGLTPSIEDVITACDTLAGKVRGGAFDAIVKPFLSTFDVSEDYFEKLLYMFTRAGLEEKVRAELSDEPLVIDGSFKRRRLPLGVLLHIAAGNFDVLPAYSMIEGLLAGNINILKLPMGDSGLSVTLLQELTNICPPLKPFIYVFDVPSTETEDQVKS